MKKPNPSHSHQAFSLVELSIVLVILGLLTGGILAGQNLVRSAELRAVTQEFTTYEGAIKLFKERYSAIPGDMKDATTYWGVSANCPGTTTQGSNIVTCNGNGNAQIESSTISPTSQEWFRAWQHLANANLVEGSFNGVTGPGDLNHHAKPGTNIPRSKLGMAGWNLIWLGVYAGNPTTTGMDYGHVLEFGGELPNSVPAGLVLTPSEVWNIDSKMDDGKPGQGMVIAWSWDTCTDASTSTSLDGNYLLSEPAKVCAIIFRKVI